MRYVYSSTDSVRVQLMRTVLETAGIACELRNEAISQAMAGMPFNPELWILHDQD